MAKQIKAAKYVEVSSKTRQGLEDVFAQAIDLVLEMRYCISFLSRRSIMYLPSSRGISSKPDDPTKAPPKPVQPKKKNCMIL